MYTRLITRIETGCYHLGKDDKFQLFVCLAVHDRLLGKIVTDLTKAVAAQHVSSLYEEIQGGRTVGAQWAWAVPSGHPPLFRTTKTSLSSTNTQLFFTLSWELCAKRATPDLASL